MSVKRPPPPGRVSSFGPLMTCARSYVAVERAASCLVGGAAALQLIARPPMHDAAVAMGLRLMALVLTWEGR